MMKTSAEDLERTYDNPDPWGYQTNPADIERKNKILYNVNLLRLAEFPKKALKFEKALDIGCGEGWITKDLPAEKIYGFEVSSQARERWPSNINKFIDWPERRFDLVLATGILYENYSWQLFTNIINSHATKYIVTCNIAGREHWPAIEQIEGKLLYLEEFPYHRGPDEMFTQRLRIYKR